MVKYLGNYLLCKKKKKKFFGNCKKYFEPKGKILLMYWRNRFMKERCAAGGRLRANIFEDLCCLHR